MFKLFLESLHYEKQFDDKSTKQKLLLNYLRSQSSPDSTKSSIYLADVIKTWHFAAQSDRESLFSSVVTVLALLLETISSLIEFREYGNRLCCTLTQDDQVQLLDRGLSADKRKKHLISPCIKLLTEVVSFDGGAAAKAVYRQQEITLKRLEIFLGMRNDFREDADPSARKYSVRDYALRYLFANLRFQKPTAKSSILAQGRMGRALFEHIAQDSTCTILENLDSLKQDIALDNLLLYPVKAQFFNGWALSRLATLYSYRDSGDMVGGYTRVQKSAHEFLLFLCTSPGRGVLHAQADQRPFSTDVVGFPLTIREEEDQSSQSRLNESFHHDCNNASVAALLQSLRPWASVLQTNLLLAIFRTAPESVASYFLKSTSFSFDPKLSATWIGYASFLLSTVQLPLPNMLLHVNADEGVPAFIEMIMESILPRPLTQRAMTRSLNQNSNLTKFFASRILTAAFRKLESVLRICKDCQYHAAEKSIASAWSRVTSNTIVQFCQRCPEMKHVIAQFRGCLGEHPMLRENLAQLITLYYKVIPELALKETFDVSVQLSRVLQETSSRTQCSNRDEVQLLYLEHMLEIAHRSPNTQWWQEPGESHRCVSL